MEILYIGLGILSSAFIFLLGYSVNGVFNTQKRIVELQEQIQNIDVNLGQIEEHIHIRINGVEKELQTNIDRVDRESTALLDSRLDKLESKLKGMIPPTNEQLEKRIKKIEEESYRLRMNM